MVVTRTKHFPKEDNSTMATNCIAILVAKYRIAGMTSWGRGTPKEVVFLKTCPLPLIPGIVYI